MTNEELEKRIEGKAAALFLMKHTFDEMEQLRTETYDWFQFLNQVMFLLKAKQTEDNVHDLLQDEAD